MDTIAALRNKRDTRTYTDQPVPDDLVRRVIDVARMAGSAKNVQPVRMVVVTDDDTKVALQDSGDFASWIGAAPVVVVITVAGDAGPRKLFDVGRHAQQLMVAAFAEGLGSCPVTIHHPGVACSILGIPEGIEPAMIVTLGWPQPGEKPPPQIASPRLALDAYASWGTWTDS
jgi:nitroreductase